MGSRTAMVSLWGGLFDGHEMELPLPPAWVSPPPEVLLPEWLAYRSLSEPVNTAPEGTPCCVYERVEWLPDRRVWSYRFRTTRTQRID